MKRIIWVAILAATGCAAHAGMRGSVVMKVSEAEAHVCMGIGEVKEGDRVRLYHNECSDKLGAGPKTTVPVPSCRKVAAGEGTVAKVLNEHYSVIRFSPGTTFVEGDTVEASK